ncbi:imidazolonepropionase [bacterium]|nr:imidazolonepropionase [bacterium]
MKADLAIIHASELITFDSTEGKEPLRGDTIKNIGIIEDGCLLLKDSKVLAYGKTEDYIKDLDAEETLDATGMVVTPGLIDAHTHPIFVKSRENEFIMRIGGATYMEIAKQGGGINSTVKSVREAPIEELVEAGRKHLNMMLSTGTTTIEAKSGYGLNVEDEIKQLEAIKILQDEHPIDIVPTFLGAHEIPLEFKNNKEEYVKLVISKMLPIVKEKGLARYCDIFCEEGVFELNYCRSILEEAKKLGFNIKMHADEFVSLGGSELGVELNATSVDHLLAVSQEAIDKLAESSTVAVLLPGTSFFLDVRKYAPARKLVDQGATIGLASDFNPGSSPTTNMILMLSLACIKMKLLPSEALAAATLNNAFAIGMADTFGSLTPGKFADIVIWDVDNYQKIPYYYGMNLINKVLKKGKIVVDNGKEN